MEQYKLSPGMKITKENADLIKDLVPEVVYQRTKNGDYVFVIGKFDPPDILTKVWDKDFYDSSERNTGKYDVDADGGIIDKASGQRPWPMPLGLPYPEIDLNEDPARVGTKMMWNVTSLAGACNEQDHDGARLFSAPRNGGYDRYFSPKVLRQYVDFRRTPIESQRPVIFQEIFFFLEPSDAFGSANLTWRWADPKKWDSVWSYSPSTRRVRRLTAANRSDSTLGTEFVQDDGTPSYNGKIEMMEWKYVGKGNALLPVARGADQAPDDYVARITYEAQHSTHHTYSKIPGAYQQRYKKTTFAFQESPQQYASWWVTDMLWVPVPVYIVEAFPKDPYYNYGRQIFFLERNTFTPVWKQIYNRSGEYWRTGGLWFEYPRYKFDGKEYVCFDGVGTIIGDEKTNRGTVGMDNGDAMLGKQGGTTVHYNTGVGGDLFELGRFLEYGK
ncbi:MAG: DUF1329 domain-containing protein [Thermodesulfobacteriota bacterium]|jgi:hypothetical protein